MAFNPTEGFARKAGIALVAGAAIVIAAVQLRSSGDKARVSSSVNGEAHEVRSKSGTRVARLRETGPVASTKHSPRVAVATVAAASFTSGSAQTTSRLRTFELPLRGPSGALASNVGLGNRAGSAAGTDATDSTETRREKWKARGLQLVPVRMVDMTSQPLEGVQVLVDGIHHGQQARETAHGGWDEKKFGPAPSEITDAEGRAYLASPVILSDISLAIGISFTASKPGYAKRRIFSYPVDGTERDEVLRKGNTLTVAAYMDTPSQRVFGFVPKVSSATHTSGALMPEDWSHMPDGSQVTESVPDGKHALTVEYKAPDGITWHSDTVPIEMRGGEAKELEVQLKRGLTLRGRLSDNVRRPVANGRVLAAAQWPPPGSPLAGSTATTMREGGADIAPDGSFEIPGLPEGPGEIIGLCDGYIAAHRQLSARPYEQNQVYNLNSDPNAALFILVMEETGGLRVRVVNSSNQPIIGARLAAWPNVFWSTGVSTLYLDEKLWSATTNGNGFAALKGFRPGSQPFTVEANGWTPPIRVDASGQATRTQYAAIIAGLTTELVVTMEPAPLDGAN
ncbi:MAG: carboxypeptidase-like regulatory domain-containing protein [Candidatus Sumerlaeaceae bacterium]